MVRRKNLTQSLFVTFNYLSISNIPCRFVKTRSKSFQDVEFLPDADGEKSKVSQIREIAVSFAQINILFRTQPGILSFS